MASSSGISAFIPTFNRGVLLKEAIASLLRQTLLPDEIIVVDDGSTDDTAQVVASFGPQVTYIHKPNGGKSSALNAGLQHSSKEFIYILDDDDIATDDALERMAEVLRKNPEYGFVHADYDAFTVSDSGTILTEERAPELADGDDLPLALMHVDRLRQQSMLVRRSCYERVGPFNEAFVRSQDYEMLLRLVRVFKGKHLDHIVCHLRQHDGIRGTAAMPIAAKDSQDAWRSFDAKVIAAIYATYSLHEFLPRPVTALTNQDRFTALLQRCVIVGRKRLWNLAANDLREACALASQFGIHELTPRQTLILKRMFDASSDGLHDLAAAVDFRSALLSIPDRTLSRQIRAATSSTLRRQIRHAAQIRAARTSAYLIACLLCLSPSVGRPINHLGNLALKRIARKRSARAAI